MSNEMIKWMFFNCPKDHSWIVYQNLPDIVSESKYIHIKGDQQIIKLDDKDQIRYIHSINMTENKLVCLLETKDGFYLINNEKKGEDLSSVVIYFPDIKTFNDKVSNSIRKLLMIKKKFKLSSEEKKINVIPYDFILCNPKNYSQLLDGSCYDDMIRLTPEVTQNILTLNLNHNMTVDDKMLSDYHPSKLISKISFHTNFRLRSLEWTKSDWSQRIKRINLTNMAHFTNNSLGYMVKNMKSLAELYVSVCPQVNIRCLLDILTIDRLEVLCLNDVRMVCQPNQYGGLIKDEEWDVIKNESLKEMAIMSDNLSLDVIDFLKKHCYCLDKMVINPKTLKYMCQNLLTTGDTTNPMYFNDGGSKTLKIGRDFQFKNLFREQFQNPFSDSMTKVMEEHYQNE